ncbi:hypothetical protein G6F65_013722 [Rhizopus arrhizus]|nr:hypothetical protein G6F65_013722 [Rhizopus arrhizus]
MQGLRGQRAVDGRHLLPDHIAALGLVSVHLQIGMLRAQQLGRLADQHVHRGIVRHRERGQQLGQGARAGPLVIGQYADRLRRVAQFLRAGLHCHVDAGAHGLLQVGHISMVGRQVQRRDAAYFTWRQFVEAQLHALRKSGIAADMHFDVFEGLRRTVGQTQGPDDGDGVLDGRVAQRRVRFDRDGDGVGRVQPSGMRRAFLDRRRFQVLSLIHRYLSANTGRWPHF